jgi:sugar/nucleoside kinase (ribokinase family)
VIWKRDKDLAFSAEDAPTDIVSRAAILHLTLHDTDAALEMARAARQSGTIVSIDVDKEFAGIEDLLLQVDLLIASSEFPSRLLGIEDHRKALPEMARRFGCRVCGVTLGERGSLLFADGVFIESAGYAVPGGCRDTTGAGDAFRVGLIYGLLNDSSVEDAARSANAVAALKCRAIGARTSLPNEKELQLFLRDQPRAA